MLCLPCISLLPSPPSTRGTNGCYTFCTRRCGASQELYDGDDPLPTGPTTGLSSRVSFERSCGVILAASCKYLRSLWAGAGGSHVDGGGPSRLLARAGGGRGCSCVVPVAAVSDACALYPWQPLLGPATVQRRPPLARRPRATACDFRFKIAPFHKPYVIRSTGLAEVHSLRRHPTSVSIHSHCTRKILTAFLALLH